MAASPGGCSPSSGRPRAGARRRRWSARRGRWRLPARSITPGMQARAAVPLQGGDRVHGRLGRRALGQFLPRAPRPASSFGGVERRAAAVDRARGGAPCCSRPAQPISGCYLSLSPACSSPSPAGIDRASCGSRRVVPVVAAALWLRPQQQPDVFRRGMLGRLPIVSPVFVYAAVLTGAGSDAPAAVHRGGRRRPGLCCGRVGHHRWSFSRGRDGRPCVRGPRLHKRAASAPLRRAIQERDGDAALGGRLRRTRDRPRRRRATGWRPARELPPRPCPSAH